MENHGQKRSADDQVDVLDGVQAILLDIEGTTTPITFVKEKLFPYIRDNVKSYLTGHFGDDECQEDITALREQATTDAEMDGVVAIPTGDDSNQDAVVDAAVNSVLWQMDADRKTTSLKQLQGHMWREAYKTGLVQGEVFADVTKAVRSWNDEGKDVFIYSSGSVEAQKLLFGYSNQGPLMELFAGFFDTTSGAKNVKESYTKIVGEMGVEAGQVAFFTDIPAEAAAAGEAGCKTVLVVREGNAPLSEEDKQKYNTISSFTELLGADSQNAKRIEADDGDDSDDAADDVDEDDLDGDDVDDVDGDDADDAEAAGEEEAA